MSVPGFSEDEQERLETEAVAWVVRLTSGDATEADHHAVEAWRRRSPAHDLAFQKAHRLWAAMEGLRESLVGSEDQPDVTPLQHRTASAGIPLSARVARRRAWTRWSAIAATLAAVAITLTLQSGFVTRLTADYSTGTGEQVTTTLADGTLLQLNTQAAVAVHYTDTARRVDLLEGEAAFRVMKDATRPFIVQTQSAHVRTVGTEFLVRTTSEATLVTVVEGIVEVRATPDGQALGAPVRVETGQRVRYGPTSGVGPVETVDLHIATAWQRGKLIFEATPLTTVVDEINRYRPGHLILLTSSLAPHRVSGVFDLDRLDSAVTTIEQTLPVTTVRLTNRFVLLR